MAVDDPRDAVADSVPEQRVPAERVVVGIDGEPASRQALRWAYDAALARGAEIEVVHAVELVQAVGPEMAPTVDLAVLERIGHELLEEVIRSELGEHADDVHVHRVVTMGSACTVLCDQAHGAAMLVVGQDRGFFRRLLPGSTSRLCLRHASCPVVVVRESDVVDTRRLPSP